MTTEIRLSQTKHIKRSWGRGRMQDEQVGQSSQNGVSPMKTANSRNQLSHKLM